ILFSRLEKLVDVECQRAVRFQVTQFLLESYGCQHLLLGTQYPVKGCAVFFTDRLRRRKHLRQRIHLLTVLPKAVAEVGACCQPGASYIPDHLTLAHALTPLYGTFAHVEVLCCIHIVVFYFDRITITAAIRGCFYHT